MSNQTPSEIDRMIDEHKAKEMGSRAYWWGHRVAGGKSSSKYRDAHYAMEDTYKDHQNKHGEFLEKLEAMKRNGTPITDKHRKESKNLLDATSKVMKEEDPKLNRRARPYMAI